MKITISKENLVEGVQVVGNVASTRTTLPILSNILIETAKGGVRFVATDMEVGIEENLPCAAKETGSVTVPAKKFSDIVRELPDGDVEINVGKQNSVSISCKKSLFRIMGMAKDEFPDLPTLPKKEESFTIDQGTLKYLLKKTSFAISNDETRYVLNGVYFIAKDNELRVVATDGRRLACIAKKVELPPQYNRDVIIPSKTVNELNRLLEDEGDMRIFISDNQVAFVVGSVVLVSRLIEGHFPNYEQVIPKKLDKRADIVNEDFMDATKRAAILTSEKSNSIKFDITKKKMILSSSTPDLGEAREEIELSAYSGDDVTIAFNPNYILDFLKNESSDKIYLDLASPTSPGVIRPANDENYLYVVMPIKV